jgi:hypothetical protein
VQAESALRRDLYRKACFKANNQIVQHLFRQGSGLNEKPGSMGIENPTSWPRFDKFSTNGVWYSRRDAP